MEWKSVDGVRRWFVVVALVLGPVLAVLSVVVGLGPEPESMRESFDVMATRSPQILAQDLLETAGFALVLAALIGAATALRSRGGALGLIGVVLAYAGIVGFAISNASGLGIVALAQLPDRDAAFETAVAVTSDGPLAVAQTAGMVLEIAGQLGILILILGLWRARLLPLWVLIPVVLGILVNAVVGTLLATLVADVLLLATGAWIAVRLARASHGAWLGTEVPSRRSKAATSAAATAA